MTSRKVLLVANFTMVIATILIAPPLFFIDRNNLSYEMNYFLDCLVFLTVISVLLVFTVILKTNCKHDDKGEDSESNNQ